MPWFGPLALLVLAWGATGCGTLTQSLRAVPEMNHKMSSVDDKVGVMADGLGGLDSKMGDLLEGAKKSTELLEEADATMASMKETMNQLEELSRVHDVLDDVRRGVYTVSDNVRALGGLDANLGHLRKDVQGLNGVIDTRLARVESALQGLGGDIRSLQSIAKLGDLTFAWGWAVAVSAGAIIAFFGTLGLLQTRLLARGVKRQSPPHRVRYFPRVRRSGVRHALKREKKDVSLPYADDAA